MRKFLTVMAMALVLCGALAMSAQAFVLDFNVVSPSGGTGVYTGGATPFVGSNIAVFNVVGLGTPANDGVSLPITNGVLSFTTGNFVGTSMDGEYFFGTGGSITVTGTIDDFSCDYLMSGSFIPSIIGENPELEPGLTGPTFIASYTDLKCPDLLAFYGLTSGQLFGEINLKFAGSLDPDGFTLTSLSGDLTNVPVPPAVWLFGTGLLGLVGLRRKLKA